MLGLGVAWRVVVYHVKQLVKTFSDSVHICKVEVGHCWPRKLRCFAAFFDTIHTSCCFLAFNSFSTVHCDAREVIVP
jgi:hypothetical protein